MDPNQQKEQFSDAFIHAAAAAAGFATSKPSVDDDSIDWMIHQTGGKGSIRSPRLELQLKCTGAPDIEAAHLRFDLNVKNYRELIPEDLMVPRILVLVVVPQDAESWLHMTEESLILRNCAYWISLRGLPPKENENTVVVRLPRVQRFDADALSSMMNRIGAGELP